MISFIYCSAYKLFEECMRDIKDQCNPLDQRMFEGIELAYEWICESGQDGNVFGFNFVL